MAGEIEKLLAFIELYRRVEKELDHFFFERGRLSTVKVLALRALSESKPHLSMTQLARATNTERHNITTLVERMQKDGLVGLNWTDLDRRLTLVSLTADGKEMADGLDAILEEAAGEVLPFIN